MKLAGSVGTGLAGLTGCTRALFNPLSISNIKHEGNQSELLDIVFTDLGSSSTKCKLLGSNLGINTLSTKLQEGQKSVLPLRAASQRPEM